MRLTIRKTATLLAAIGLIAIMMPLQAAPVLASGSSQFDTNYNNYCIHGYHNVEPYGYDWVRADASGDPNDVGSRILGARGKITARALWPCLDGDGFYVSKSLILAADIQSDASRDGAYNFAQAGLGKINYQSGLYQCSGQDQMVNDQTHFIYVPDPTDTANGGGNFCRAGFVDFNNDGVPDDPIGGRQYLISVFEHNTSSGAKKWRYCFEDLYTLATSCKNTPRTTNKWRRLGPQCSMVGMRDRQPGECARHPNRRQRDHDFAIAVQEGV